MLALIKTGGKQYLVSPGDKIKVEKLDKEEGKEITFDEVLLLCPSDLSVGALAKAGALVKEGVTLSEVVIGNPLVKGAEVKARILKHGKGEKLIIFKYKPKKRYKKKIGHRQLFTEVEIVAIVANRN